MLDVAATMVGVAVVASQIMGGASSAFLLAVLGASYALWAAGMQVNLRANWSLLERTGMSTNALSKLLSDLARRRSNGPGARRAAAGVGYVASELAKEAPYYAGAFGTALVSDAVDSPDAIIFLAGTNLGAALYEYGLARLTLMYLDRRRPARIRRSADAPETLLAYVRHMPDTPTRTVDPSVHRAAERPVPGPSTSRPSARISARTFDFQPARTGSGRVPPVFARPSAPVIVEPTDPPEPRVSAPHLGAQIDFSPLACPTGSTIFDISEAIRQFLAPVSTAVEVRVRCNESANVFTVAAWLSQSPNPAEREARERGIDELALLGSVGDGAAETLGLFVSTRLIRELSAAEFAAMPKRYSNSGSPQHDGPIHITALRPELRPPNRILTIVEGFTDQTWPDIDFTLTITDTLSAGMRPLSCGARTEDAGFIRCRSEKDVDTDGGDLVAAIAATIVGIPIVVGFFNLAELIDVASIGGGGSGGGLGGQGGIGCRIAELAHTPISLPGRDTAANQGVQVIETYGRVEVTRGGLFVGGAWMTCLRNARLHVDGPSFREVFIDEESVSAVYRAVATETSGDVSVSWSVTPEGGALIERPDSTSTRITFVNGEFLGDARFGYRVTVNGRDADGSIPPATRLVTIQLTDNPLPASMHGRPNHDYPREPSAP